ncbi:hypothetical protein SAMN05444411_10984 [Lutibacter oricola]|uniref:Uncharacterized protein n=1 Tax=Lutibacter oricola TaxID=762486 RepID=A0A1H3EFI9_9FLAO|nr:hypothetical protein [Lutibacter oricola]SDX77390.1 hypothetical protein SAMN05444411_10984 [Lutibacter oricola]
MKTLKNLLVTSLFLIATTIVFAQKNSNKLPTSIYTTTFNTENTSSSFFINNKLDLKSLEFGIVDLQDLKFNYFTIPAISVKGKPSSYIYDSYNKAQLYKDLEKSFFKIEELYRVRTKMNL